MKCLHFFFFSFRFNAFTDQQLFYKSALKEIESLMSDMNSMISKSSHTFANSSEINFISYRKVAINKVCFETRRLVKMET